jgi:hypothetical protein
MNYLNAYMSLQQRLRNKTRKVNKVKGGKATYYVIDYLSKQLALEETLEKHNANTN